MFFFDFGDLASGSSLSGGSAQSKTAADNGSILSGGSAKSKTAADNGSILSGGLAKSKDAADNGSILSGGFAKSKTAADNGSILSGGLAKSKDADYAQPLYLIGASPEMHVRYSDGIASIRPIAGTRPRGQTPADDRTLEHDLLADPKERAEHVMLVDLARNDLGRVCKYGTVRVSEQMVVERYSHVMHIVSHVDGELRPGLDAFDLVRATFPAGTVSGAPKVRAMQIIRDLEPEPRGIYSGAVGYFGYDGNADTCLAIRTLVMQGQTVHIQAGAGIVADSDPELEYEETVNKAKAIAVAIELAEGGRK